MTDGRHFEKKPLNRYLSNRLTDFDEIWHMTQIGPYRGKTVKISNFSKTKMAAAAVVKNDKKIAISQQRINRSSQNLVRLCKMGLLTAQTINKLNFQNPRWRTADSLKTVKSLYLSNRLTDFDEIWRDDADWPPTGDRSLKFRIFQKPRWRRPPS